MAASVRIEDEAFVDPRVELLGALAGYNRFEALGRLAHLWRVCTQRESYVLPEAFVVACLGEKGADAIIGSGLGERTPDGIRVRGTRGRIEWLQTRRAAAKAGGEANKSRATAGGKPKAPRRKPSDSARGAKRSQAIAPGEPKGSQEAPTGEPNHTPPTPTPTASLTPCLPSEDSDPQPPAGRPVESEPFDPLRAEQAARKLFEERWNAAGLKRMSRLTHTLHGRLAALLLNPWWAANYPAALERAGRIPFLATGAGRRGGPYDVGVFLRDDDECRKIIDGVYDQHAAPATIPFAAPNDPKALARAAFLAAEARDKAAKTKPAEGTGT